MSTVIETVVHPAGPRPRGMTDAEILTGLVVRGSGPGCIDPAGQVLTGFQAAADAAAIGENDLAVNLTGDQIEVQMRDGERLAAIPAVVCSWRPLRACAVLATTLGPLRLELLGPEAPCP